MVMEGPGTNCNVETAHGLEMAGAVPVGVHRTELLDGSVNMDGFDMMVLPGGFGDGDTIRSGAIFGRILKERFAEDINKFIELGKPVVGICNGFQVLVEAGLLPGGTIDSSIPKQASLIHNESGKFECGWTTVKVGESACKFVAPELVGTLQKLPIAHGEGRLVVPNGLDQSQVVLSYTDPSGGSAGYPDNPNGSPDGVTAVCDPSGVVLGMMPHPERALYPHQHQNWRRGEGQNPFGAVLFRAIVNHAKQL